MRTPLERFTQADAYSLAPMDYLLFQDHPGLLLVAGQQPDPKTRAYTWYFRHRDVAGKIARVKLGRWPATSFADACSERERIDRERQRGTNHLAEKRQARESKKAEAEQAKLATYTMASLVEDYLAALARRRTRKSVYDTTLVLRPLAECAEPVVEWTRSKASALLHSIADRAPSMSRTLRAEMSIAVEDGIGRGVIPETYANPWTALRHDPALKAKTKRRRRSRYLNDAELATWLAWLPKSGVSELAKDALLLTLLTGARSGEVVKMQKSHIVDGVWTIPKTKTDQPRSVKLPRQALAIVERRSTREYLFPSPNGKAIAQRALVWQVAKHGKTSGVEDWSAHDLRRSCRTGLARLGCPTEVAEAALGHSQPTLVATYNLHRYQSEVGEWLQKWCNHLDALQSPNVVPMRKQA